VVIPAAGARQAGLASLFPALVWDWHIPAFVRWLQVMGPGHTLSRECCRSICVHRSVSSLRHRWRPPPASVRNLLGADPAGPAFSKRAAWCPLLPVFARLTGSRRTGRPGGPLPPGPELLFPTAHVALGALMVGLAGPIPSPSSTSGGLRSQPPPGRWSADGYGTGDAGHI